MQKTPRLILTELLWLILSLGVAFLLSALLFGLTFSTDEVDIHLYDTIYIVSRWLILIPLFLLVTFSIYFLSEARKSFRRPLSNWVLLVSGFALIVSLTFLVKSLSVSHFSAGWTMYPPLSALGTDKAPEITEDHITKTIATFLSVLQAVVLCMLLFAVYCWGKKPKQPTQPD